MSEIGKHRQKQVNAAADALLGLYPYGGDFLASVFEAGWLTDYERNAFAQLATALRERDEQPSSGVLDPPWIPGRAS